MAKKSDGAPAAPQAAPASESFLESVRHNVVGTLASSLVVAIAVGLLLSVLVPSEPNLLALVLLGLFVAAAVGFTVRYLALTRGLLNQAVALLATVIGVHLMTVTGSVGGDVAGLAGLGGGGIEFDDAVLAALATPAISVGPLLAGLVAVIIVGWGRVSASADGAPAARI